MSEAGRAGAPPFQIERIDHVVLRVRELETAVRFYVRVLGCIEERRLPDFGLVQLRAGASLIDLIDRASSLAELRSASNAAIDHVALLVDCFDTQALRAHLAAHGIEASDIVPRYGAEGVGPSLYIRDPDGNTIELKGRPGRTPARAAHRSLITERLTLDPLHVDDARALHAAYGDAATMREWWHGPSKDLDETRRALVREIGGVRGPARGWAVRHARGDALGLVLLSGIAKGQAALSYLLVPDARGHGYAREAAAAVADHAFSDLKLHRLTAAVGPHNAASIAVLRALGFEQEGRATADWPLDGTFVDSLHFARVAPDFTPAA